MQLAILLSLSATLLFWSLPSQEKGEIWSLRSYTTYQLLPNGKIRSKAEETIAWNLPPKFELLLDEEFSKHLETRRLGELQKLARAAKAEAAEIDKKISREPEKAKEFASEWEAYLKDAEKRFNATIGPAGLRILESSETTDSFFKLGFMDFMKQRLPKGKVVPKLDDVTSKSIRSNLRTIESRVLEVLLSDLAVEKQVELKEVLASAIPDRNPSLSLFWQSLLSLKAKQVESASLPTEEAIFIVQSGRLVKVGSQPIDDVSDLMELIADVAKRQESQAIREELGEVIRELHQRRTELEAKVNKKIEELSTVFFDERKIRAERKKLADEYYSDLRELASKFIENSEPGLRGQLRGVKFVVNYQRFGIEKALFSDPSRKLLEFPMSAADRKLISGKAKEARRLLEDQVQLLLRNLFRDRIASQIPADDASVRWLDSKYTYQIPPVELLSNWFGN